MDRMKRTLREQFRSILQHDYTPWSHTSEALTQIPQSEPMNQTPLTAEWRRAEAFRRRWGIIVAYEIVAKKNKIAAAYGSKAFTGAIKMFAGYLLVRLECSVVQSTSAEGCPVEWWSGSVFEGRNFDGKVKGRRTKAAGGIVV